MEGQNVLLMDYWTNNGTLWPNNGYLLAKMTLLIVIRLCLFLK